MMTQSARRISRLSLLATCAVLIAQTAGLPAAAQEASVYAPYNADLLRGGDGLIKPLAGSPLPALGPWTLQGWILPANASAGCVVVSGVGDLASGRFIVLDDGALAFLFGTTTFKSPTVLKPGAWTHVAAVSDGTTVTLYVDGAKAGEGGATPVALASAVLLGPRKPAGTLPLGGKIAGVTAQVAALTPAELKALAATRPDTVLTVYEPGSPTWPVQVRQVYGQVSPQDAWTCPRSKAAISKPIALAPYAGPALVAAPAREGAAVWILKRWSLVDAPKVSAGGTALSRPGYDAKAWYAATVPGTVLTTLVDRGVYPNPDFGLNNTAIPESLNKHDYWYRAEFIAPSGQDGLHQQMIFKGINYAAEIWLNGERLGDLKGTSIRGQFDVTDKLKPGVPNAVVVKVSPPPHPGLAHEESLTEAVGENGGMMALDGPTFVASEGWDWIPSVRDRNTGLWQDVVLRSSGSAPALNGKLTLVDAKGTRILPAYYAHNYVSLLPGERRTVEIRYPGEARAGAKGELRGWNVTPAKAAIGAMVR